MLPKVLVDWYGTLASKTGGCKANEWGLERLLGKADVYLLSWVGSKARKVSTLQEMEALGKAMLDKLRFHGTTCQKLGQNGKVDHAASSSMMMMKCVLRPWPTAWTPTR